MLHGNNENQNIPDITKPLTFLLLIPHIHEGCGLFVEREGKRPSSGNKGLLGVICLLWRLKNWFHILEKSKEVRGKERVRKRGKGGLKKDLEIEAEPL